jgi:FAD:protein FMN transferase
MPEKTACSHRRLRIALGTWVAVEATAPCPEQRDAAIEAAFGAVLEVEREMHPTRKGSDLAMINAVVSRSRRPEPRRGCRREALSVRCSTWELLQFAKRLYDLSDGIFEPCLPELPGRLSDIELLSDCRVRCHVPVRLDFGGFAKGYAIDRAITLLLQHGCSSGLVNAGGDLRVFGPRAQRVFVRQAEGTFRPVELTDSAIAVSAFQARHRPPGHRGYYRRTAGVPDTTSRQPQAVIVAPEAVIADALTKCVLLGEPAVAARVLRAMGGVELS